MSNPYAQRQSQRKSVQRKSVYDPPPKYEFSVYDPTSQQRHQYNSKQVDLLNILTHKIVKDLRDLKVEKLEKIQDMKHRSQGVEAALTCLHILFGQYESINDLVVVGAKELYLRMVKFQEIEVKIERIRKAKQVYLSFLQKQLKSDITTLAFKNDQFIICNQHVLKSKSAYQLIIDLAGHFISLLEILYQLNNKEEDQIDILMSRQATEQTDYSDACADLKLEYDQIPLEYQCPEQDQLVCMDTSKDYGSRTSIDTPLQVIIDTEPELNKKNTGTRILKSSQNNYYTSRNKQTNFLKKNQNLIDRSKNPQLNISATPQTLEYSFGTSDQHEDSPRREQLSKSPRQQTSGSKSPVNQNLRTTQKKDWDNKNRLHGAITTPRRNPDRKTTRSKSPVCTKPDKIDQQNRVKYLKQELKTIDCDIDISNKKLNDMNHQVNVISWDIKKEEKHLKTKFLDKSSMDYLVRQEEWRSLQNYAQSTRLKEDREYRDQRRNSHEQQIRLGPKTEENLEKKSRMPSQTKRVTDIQENSHVQDINEDPIITLRKMVNKLYQFNY